MKQLLLFQPGVETLKFFSERLAEEYVKMGYEVRIVRIHEPFLCTRELTDYLQKRPGETVLITFNYHALQREAIFHTKEKVLLWDLYDVFCINIIVDHPFYYYEELQYLPDRYLQICIDEDHTDYMRRFYPEVALGTTLPIPGCLARSRFPLEEHPSETVDFQNVRDFMPSQNDFFELKPQTERSTPVVFTGCFTNPDFFLPYMSRNGEDYRAFYQGILDDLLACPDRCIHTVFLQHLNRELPDLSTEDLKNVMNKMIFLDLWIRFTYRGRAIGTIVDSGIPVHCIGAGWETLQCKKADLLTQTGYSDTSVCLRALADAQISLNVMPWFKRGAHDRIYSSMHNGAVCVTDPSEYLKANFPDGRELVYYSLSELDRLPEIVQRLLASPDVRESIASRAMQRATAQLGWEPFAKALLPYIER